MALRALREDIQDQHGPVDHSRIQFGGQVAHLRGGKVMIENDQRGFQSFYQLGDFLHLAAAREQRRVGTLPPGSTIAKVRTPAVSASKRNSCKLSLWSLLPKSILT